MTRKAQHRKTNMQSALHNVATLLRRNKESIRHHRGGAMDIQGLIWRFVAVVLSIVVIYLIVKLFYTNVRDYPPLLTTPIQGDIFDPYPNNTFPRKKPLPAVKRQNRPDGFSLPYQSNRLAMLPSRVLLPEHNVQNRMTLSFWMKPENMVRVYSAQTDAKRSDRYAYLLAMNYTTTSVHSDPSQPPFDPTNLAVLYSANDNDLVVRVRVNSQLGLMQEFHIPNAIKIQRWQMITIVVDNRDLDVYINHQLHRSFLMSNVPLLGFNTWNLFPGMIPFGGTLTCARFFGYALNHHEVHRLYKRQHSKDIPSMSFLRWWTWIPSTALSRLLS